LLARIRQLEHGMHISLIWLSSNRILWILKFWSIWFVERDELRKDIEQLCMQQAGPGYLAVATRMHFQRYQFYLFSFCYQEIYVQLSIYLLYWLLWNSCPIRTAGLEQEIESLKNKLAVCTRDSLNLQEELSEAYRIKVSN
jgi:hypothetical protein